MSDKENLDSILPEFRSISDAPNSVTEMFESHKIAYNEDRIGEVFGLERKRKYKSLDSEKNVFLIQNPFSWKTIEKDGVSYKFRKPPEPQGKLSSFMTNDIFTKKSKKYSNYEE